MINYVQYTTYTEPEDLKRLDFIVNNIRMEVPAKASILDIGCGNGNISLALGSLGYTVKGIDISETSIKNSQQRNKFSNVHFQTQDAEDLPSQNVSFDAIVCSEVLEHLQQPEKLISIIHLLLKPKGVLIVTVPNGYGPRELLVTRPVIWLVKNGVGGFIDKTKNALKYSNSTVQSDNQDLTHIQFFRKKTLAKILHKYAFESKIWGKANFIEKVFPFSFVTNRVVFLKKWDCKLADYLPLWCSSGFYTVWKKSDF